MAKSTIGVGIIGYEVGRSWGATAHVPALRSLPEFDIAAVATTRQESALAAAKDIGLPENRAFASAAELAACPDVDVVAVTVKVPFHLDLVRTAIAAGKHVYCEWPLGNGLEEAEQMAALIRDSELRGAIGLQARCAPAIRYVKDMVQAGEIGDLLSSHIFATGIMWGDWVNQPNAYVLDGANGATMLTIPFGHAVDAMCYALGEFRDVTAVTATRIPKVRLVETGEFLDKNTPDQIIVSGQLENDAVAAVHYRGGSSRGANFVWEINGSKGDLRLEAPIGHAQMADLALSGGFGKDRQLAPLEIPATYRWAPEGLTNPALNVAQSYLLLADDLRDGTHSAADFDDAVVRHRLLQAIEQAARSGSKVTL
ncbi:MAG: Gfo/Idh/MocA family oxidoreductase [Parasphingorhabdus sp.]|nr:Gfo/Idh/MocA family oxidoreductase [Parasphingorhabdus sp.]